mmetsp:Transcript_31721/g.73612  ORF Transcript_31721/g.73612 Transcript_31721/m.73612 type:complete len:255 (-) Transcript_31721:16-780(-)
MLHGVPCEDVAAAVRQEHDGVVLVWVVGVAAVEDAVQARKAHRLGAKARGALLALGREGVRPIKAEPGGTEGDVVGKEVPASPPTLEVVQELVRIALHHLKLVRFTTEADRLTASENAVDSTPLHGGEWTTLVRWILQVALHGRGTLEGWEVEQARQGVLQLLLPVGWDWQRCQRWWRLHLRHLQQTQCGLVALVLLERLAVPPVAWARAVDERQPSDHDPWRKTHLRASVRRWQETKTSCNCLGVGATRTLSV